MLKIDTSTQLCAVIGNPVAHSLSPAMHNAAFEYLGLNFVYLAFQVEDVGGCIAGMRALSSFRGLSVTIPHKETIMQFLDDIEPMARTVGCVNTVTKEKGRLIGSITDGLGTLRAFEEAGVNLDEKRVLFIGAGGAVRAVAFAFVDKKHVASVTILGRTHSRLEKLVSDLKAHTNIPIHAGLLSRDLVRAIETNDIIIQGTPMGMYPNNDVSFVPAECLHANHVVFDMVYRPLKTRLICDAEARGCKTILGIEMLIHQATFQFEQWTGCSAPVEVMRKAALKALTSDE